MISPSVWGAYGLSVSRVADRGLERQADLRFRNKRFPGTHRWALLNHQRSDLSRLLFDTIKNDTEVMFGDNLIAELEHTSVSISIVSAR
jgi:hypothetical protein